MHENDFLRILEKKIKTGNLRSIHLNCLPGRSATRLDMYALRYISDNLPNLILNEILSNSNFNIELNSNIRTYDEDGEQFKRKRLLVIRRLNTLFFENEDSYLEHGIKTFGLGYPLLIKRMKSDPNRIVKAPIMIWNLDLVKSPNMKDCWTLSRTEDHSININEFLISHLASDEGLKINNLSEDILSDSLVDSDELLSICNHFAEQLNFINKVGIDGIQVTETPSLKEIEEYSTDEPWISWSGVFGLFRNQKHSIIRDIESLIDINNNGKDEKLSQEIHRTSTISGVETDPSQEQVINTLTDSKSKIIQGPPGTGKSQTLTAIISNALENNTRCLVVCEKKTALDVIYNNLAEIGLGDFCAVIDDISKDRKKIIESARHKFEELKNYYSIFSENEYIEYHKKFESMKEEIVKRHHAALETILPDYSWKDIIAKYLNSLKCCDKNVLKGELNEKNYKYDDEEYKLISGCINEGMELYKQEIVVNEVLTKIQHDFFSKDYGNYIKIDFLEHLSQMKNRLNDILSDIQNGLEYGFLFRNNSKLIKFILKSTIFASKRNRQILINKSKINSDFDEIRLDVQQLFAISSNSLNTKEITNYIVAFDELHSLICLIESIDKLQDDFSHFYKWKYYYLRLQQNVGDIIDVFMNANVEVSKWTEYFNLWYFDSLLKKYEPEIGPFLQSDVEINKMKKFQDYLQKKQRYKIKDVWSKGGKFFVDHFQSHNGSIKSLYNFRKNKMYSKRNSLRKIIHTDFNLFTTLFPVVLVNPDVCSSILPLKKGLFEFVIFDEASQLKLEETYPSYYRGITKIISGDKHQMPPSNYFQADTQIMDNETEDVDSSEYDGTVDLAISESLLEYAENSDFSYSYLDFHYRSRHPYLIDFSNNSFYGGRLVPMPASIPSKPIRLVRVNGLYENRKNEKEALTAIDIVFKRIKLKSDGTAPSVGIATMNIEQRNLILSLIHDQCTLSPEFAHKYELLQKAGFFVKNLENIQGDERDAIIISTTFGNNSDGVFSQKFGPINQNKGYKLLNVIITRAKYRLFVLTSIPKSYYSNFEPELVAKGNVGKAIFYAFLSYAESIEQDNHKRRKYILELLKDNCTESSNEKESSFVESPFEQEVYDYLVKYVDKDIIFPQYRIGGFRVDFVIKAGKKLLAIECDGAKYHRTDEAYAYDMFRQKQLEALGLVFHRIWSTNWWANTKGELHNLVEFINRYSE